MRRSSPVRLTRTAVAVAVLASALGCASAPRDRSAEAQRLLDRARTTFGRFVADPDMKAFRATLADAKGVLVVPEVNKGGFIFAGSGGVGVLVARDEKRADWAGPAFYTVGSASVGLQAGGSTSEVILLVMTQKALDALLVTSTKLGGEVSAAAGPVGTGTGEVGVDVVSYARSKGLFVGLSLTGSVIRPSEERNEAFYGRKLSPLDVLVRREGDAAGAAALLADIADATR